MARGTDCAVHSHRTPVPQENHHIQPVSRGGPTQPDNMVRICANAHGNIHYLMDAIERYARPHIGKGTLTPTKAWQLVPGGITKTYSDAERKYARAGWMKYGRAFLDGKLSRQVALFTTAGAPRRGDF